MVGSAPAVTLARQRCGDVWEITVLLRGSHAAFAVAAALVWVAGVGVSVVVLFERRGGGGSRGVEATGEEVAGVYEWGGAGE